MGSLETMRTDGHLKDVAVLCRKRREEGRPWAARCMPSNIGGGGKVVHFIRHGEADHNALAAEDGAAACGCKRAEPTGHDAPNDSCPYNQDAAFDAALTEVGKGQARALAETCAGLGVQLVCSSPLRRTLQTALAAFGDFVDAELLGPVVAHEMLREQHGMHRCDKRRDTAAIAAEFGKRERFPPISTPFFSILLHLLLHFTPNFLHFTPRLLLFCSILLKFWLHFQV